MIRLPSFARSTVIKLLWGKSGNAAVESAKKLKCAIFKHDRIGDFILAQGAIRLLAEHFGQEGCVLVVSSLVAPLAKAWFPRMHVVAIPHPKHGLLRTVLPYYLRYRPQVAAFHADIAVCLRHQRYSFYDILFSWIHRTKSIGTQFMDERYRPGESHPLFEQPFDEAVDYPTQIPAGYCQELEANRLVVERVIGRSVDISEVLPRIETGTYEIPGRLLLVPFSSAEIKNYPIDALSAALAQIPSHLQIVLAPAPEDFERSKSLVERLKGNVANTFEIVPPKNLSAYIEEVAKSEYVLTMDSAAAHIATALNKRTVVILGGGHYGMFGPWHRSSRQIWLSHPMDCYHCAWNCIHPEPYCITRIEPQKVVQAINQLFLSDSPK